MLDELTITYATARQTGPTVWPFAPSLRVQTPTDEKVATVVTVLGDLIAQTRLLPGLADRPDADAALREVLVRWSVGRLQRILADSSRGRS